jgi:hypothetical protein
MFMLSMLVTALINIPLKDCSDLFTMRHFKKDFTKLKVAIIGDVIRIVEWLNRIFMD